MNNLILVRGVPGSGKSTLARILRDHYKAAHFEADMYFTDFRGGYVFDGRVLHLAHQWCQAGVERAMKQTCSTVIVSNTFPTEPDMEPYVKLAHGYGYQIQVIECKADFGSIHGVPDDTKERMIDLWESLPPCGF